MRTNLLHGRPIFDLAAGNVDHELGELGGIAGALGAAHLADISHLEQTTSLPLISKPSDTDSTLVS